MRGKHGAAAAVRHEVQSAAQQISACKTTIARLTGELAEAKALNARQAEGHRRVERELLARVDDGSSARTDALSHTVGELRSKLDQTEHAFKQLSETVLNQFLKIIRDELAEAAVGEEVVSRIIQRLYRKTPGGYDNVPRVAPLYQAPGL